MTFRVLQEACDTNPALLNTRLKELREAQLVDHGEQGYELTPLGFKLVQALLPLVRWADDWAKVQRTAARV